MEQVCDRSSSRQFRAYSLHTNLCETMQLQQLQNKSIVYTGGVGDGEVGVNEIKNKNTFEEQSFNSNDRAFLTRNTQDLHFNKYVKSFSEVHPSIRKTKRPI